MDFNKVIFFRNDDAGMYSTEPVSPELINLTNLFLEEKIPISHGVVPAVVSRETVEWLRDVKSKYPHLIGIDQHGYAHRKYERGEFGGNRGYQEQKMEISAGLSFMKEKFGLDFSYCFTAPWVKYNRDTKLICNELGYKIFSGGVSPKLHARIFNNLGRILNLTVLGSKEVSYHRRNHFGQNGFSVAEVSVSIDVTENYQEKFLKSNELIFHRYKKCKRYFYVIGFMLHHWVFDSQIKLNHMKTLLTELKQDSDISFKLLEDVPDVIKG